MTIVGKGQSDAVCANIPVIGIVCLLEIRQQRHSRLELGQFFLRNGGEASVVQSRNDGVLGDTYGQWLRLKRANAAAKGDVAVVIVIIVVFAVKGVPGDEKGR